MIADEPESNLKVEDAQGAAVTMYSAGQDTTTNTIISALTNLLLNPEIQKKAQEEMDAVTGRQRLPEMKDRESLPYLDSIITEVSNSSSPFKSLKGERKLTVGPDTSVVPCNTLGSAP